MGNLLENDIYHFITILTSENATMFIYFIKKNVYCILLITASLYNNVLICYVEAERMASREMLLFMNGCGHFRYNSAGHGINQRQNL